MAKRTTLGLAALFAAAALAAGGCKKDEKKKTEGAPATEASSAFALIPSTAKMVVGVNFDRITSSALYKRFKPMIDENASQELTKLKAYCGLDPMEEVDSLTFAIIDAEAEDMVVLVDGLERETLNKCAQGAAAEANDDKTFAVANDGDVTTITSDGEPMAFIWLDNDTFIGGPKYDSTKLAALKSNKDSLQSSAAFMQLASTVDTKAAVWSVVKGDVAEGPVSFQSATFDLDLSQGIDIDAKATMTEASEAQSMVTQMNQQLEAVKATPVGKYLSKLSVQANGQDIVLDLVMSDSDVNELIETAKTDPQMQFIGAMIMSQLGGQ